MSTIRRPLADPSELRPGAVSVTVSDMDTVHEENDNDRTNVAAYEYISGVRMHILKISRSDTPSAGGGGLEGEGEADEVVQYTHE
ncbi:hypothetical protein EVAR_27758_1 [Eumeta japonica]|uniref:Uncharacterized protein n=1 Tax=Eumeta variegata TaxID=151549 RepID=A0A4C1VA05_EUMVA|nr:hypothetical protein EVAR_27758_1 [Eumeta japonica]